MQHITYAMFEIQLALMSAVCFPEKSWKSVKGSWNATYLWSLWPTDFISIGHAGEVSLMKWTILKDNSSAGRVLILHIANPVLIHGTPYGALCPQSDSWEQIQEKIPEHGWLCSSKEKTKGKQAVYIMSFVNTFQMPLHIRNTVTQCII